LNSHSLYLQCFCPWLRRRFLTRDLFFFLPGNFGFPGTKIFYTTAENKSKEENSLADRGSFYFFFTTLTERDREMERDEDDREGAERETRERDVLMTDREGEERLDEDIRLEEE
jgi:hypothetical protein